MNKKLPPQDLTKKDKITGINMQLNSLNLALDEVRLAHDILVRDVQLLQKQLIGLESAFQTKGLEEFNKLYWAKSRDKKHRHTTLHNKK